MIVLFSFVIYWTAGGTMRTYRFGPEAVQETRTLILTLHRLSTEIEGFRTRLGRLPNGEAELVALRGKPMPPYYPNYRVRYTRDHRTGYYPRLWSQELLGAPLGFLSLDDFLLWSRCRATA